MRRGVAPRDAAEQAIARIARYVPGYFGALVAVDKHGNHAGAAFGCAGLFGPTLAGPVRPRLHSYCSVLASQLRFAPTHYMLCNLLLLIVIAWPFALLMINASYWTMAHILRLSHNRLCQVLETLIDWLSSLRLGLTRIRVYLHAHVAR